MNDKCDKLQNILSKLFEERITGGYHFETILFIWHPAENIDNISREVSFSLKNGFVVMSASIHDLDYRSVYCQRTFVSFRIDQPEDQIITLLRPIIAEAKKYLDNYEALLQEARLKHKFLPSQ